MTAVPGLAALRVLVVEDDMLIALLIEDTLQSLGCVVVGPASRLDAALRLADATALDAAVLDINVRGGAVYPVAERLRSRGIPFVLASGYGDWALPEAFRNQPRLSKPFTANDLQRELSLLMAGQRER